MNANQLHLGYQYTKSNKTQMLYFFFDGGLYFVNGFINDIHINKPFETFKDAKQFFNKPYLETL